MLETGTIPNDWPEDQVANAGQFQPGKSGNPGGRRKRIPKWVARFRALEPAMLKLIVQLVEDKDEKGVAGANYDMKDRIAALKIGYAYARGNPKQGVELSGTDGAPLDLRAKVVFVYPSNGREITPPAPAPAPDIATGTAAAPRPKAKRKTARRSRAKRKPKPGPTETK